MTRTTPTVRALAVLFLVVATAALASGQGWRKRATSGPYRVVVTDSVEAHGSTIMEVFVEDPKLTQAFNQLRQEGYAPSLVAPIGDRIVIVAEER